MNTTSFRLIPVLIFSLLSPLALAMGDNSTESKTPDRRFLFILPRFFTVQKIMPAT